MKHLRTYPYLILGLTFGCLFLSGCDNTFTPFSEEEIELFAINGILDVNADTQFVRVQLVRKDIIPTASLDDGIRVELTDQSTSASVELTDSLVTLDSGVTAHLFYSVSPVEGGRVYEITATGPNGGSTSSTTNVPGRVQLVLNPPSSQTTPITQGLALRGLAERPESLTVTYTVLRHGTGDPIEITIPYDNLAVVKPEAVELSVRLQQDRVTVMTELGLPFENETTILQSVNLQYELLSDEWKSVPGPLQLDFFASAATYVESWTLPDNILSEIGYAIP